MISEWYTKFFLVLKYRPFEKMIPFVLVLLIIASGFLIRFLFFSRLKTNPELHGGGEIHCPGNDELKDKSRAKSAHVSPSLLASALLCESPTSTGFCSLLLLRRRMNFMSPVFILKVMSLSILAVCKLVFLTDHQFADCTKWSPIQPL